MQHSDLPNHLIYLCLHGSRAYGIHNPESDYDIRGVGIGNLSDYFGTQPWGQIQGVSPYLLGLTQQKYPKCSEDDLDSEVYNITKFVRLLADANPNVLDILFCHPDDYIYKHPLWDELYQHRHKFLSMRIRHTFTGYAMSQLKRIKGHRSWLLNPPTDKPRREDYGLPPNHSLVDKNLKDLAESMMRKKIQAWQINHLLEELEPEKAEDIRLELKEHFEMLHGRDFDQNKTYERGLAALQAGINNELFIRLDAEKRYHSANQHWNQYLNWKKNRNPKRAALEEKFGFDLKHATHLVRLLLSAEEVLTTGDLSVRHPQADLLREIRNGSWEYEELIKWAEDQKNKIHTLSNKKPLPHSPDRKFLNELVTDLVLKFHKK